LRLKLKKNNLKMKKMKKTLKNVIIASLVLTSSLMSCTYIDGIIAVSGVTLDKTSVSIEVGEVELLTATVQPVYAILDRMVRWTTGDATVATVSNGLVTAIAIGTATIMVITNDGEHPAICQVTVVERVVAVSGVTLDNTSLSVVTGEIKQLTVSIQPANATDKTVTWTSSNESVATVENGVIYALKAGTATIMVITNNGARTAICQVTVTEPVIVVTGVTLNNLTLTLEVGETETLTATVQPTNATDKTVTWTSSDESVATVANGVVSTLSEGTSIITVTTNDGNHTATCQVTVTDTNDDKSDDTDEDID